jgi:hypothetical protein
LALCGGSKLKRPSMEAFSRTANRDLQIFWMRNTSENPGKTRFLSWEKMVIDGKFTKFRIRMRIRMGISSNLVKSDPKI